MISEEYQKQLVDLHKSPVFGNKKEIPSKVIDLINEHNIKSILDFGCGKGLLVDSLKKEFPEITVYGYDPSDPDRNTLPKKVDMILSFDVLEHIEPQFINETLISLKTICDKVMHHVIACHPAKRVLNDGRNAHLIIENPNWWKIKISEQIGWSMLDENVISYTSNPKKGNPIEVVKYSLTLKNGKS
jgi:cyclopropane fatty-acyl-phospholipid synthase-like methyltransferase